MNHCTALDRRIFRSHCELRPMFGCFTTLTKIKLHSLAALILQSVQISSPFLCLVFLKDFLTYGAKGFKQIFNFEDFQKIQEIPAKDLLKIDD